MDFIALLVIIVIFYVAIMFLDITFKVLMSIIVFIIIYLFHKY